MAGCGESKISSEMSSSRRSKSVAEVAAKAKEQREHHIEILEKYYGRYERKIKRNERAMKKPYVLETPGYEGTAIPEDLGKLWMRDIIALNARENVRRALPKHRQNLEQLEADIEKLKMERPEEEISPMSRATIYKKWNLGAVGVKELLLQGQGLWY